MCKPKRNCAISFLSPDSVPMDSVASRSSLKVYKKFIKDFGFRLDEVWVSFRTRSAFDLIQFRVCSERCRCYIVESCGNCKNCRSCSQSNLKAVFSSKVRRVRDAIPVSPVKLLKVEYTNKKLNCGEAGFLGRCLGSRSAALQNNHPAELEVTKHTPKDKAYCKRQSLLQKK